MPGVASVPGVPPVPAAVPHAAHVARSRGGRWRRGPATGWNPVTSHPLSGFPRLPGSRSEATRYRVAPDPGLQGAESGLSGSATLD